MDNHRQYRFPFCILDKNKTVAQYSTYHQYTPEDNKTNDRHSRRWRGKRLSESSEDNDHQLQTVHLLTTNHICEVSESELTKNRTTGGSDFDGGVARRRNCTLGDVVLEENYTQHRGHQVDGEDLQSS
jgi:hypothetical protein